MRYNKLRLLRGGFCGNIFKNRTVCPNRQQPFLRGRRHCVVNQLHRQVTVGRPFGHYKGITPRNSVLESHRNWRTLMDCISHSPTPRHGHSNLARRQQLGWLSSCCPPNRHVWLDLFEFGKRELHLLFSSRINLFFGDTRCAKSSFVVIPEPRIEASWAREVLNIPKICPRFRARSLWERISIVSNY